MGYDLHITRRAEWSEPESGPPITREEFARVVLGDVRFRRDEDLGPDYAVLVNIPDGADELQWLCWRDGEIMTKNPARSFVGMAARIARTLNARAVGDDGEEYGDDGSVVGEGVGDAALPGGHTAEESAPIRQWRRSRLIFQAVGIAAMCALAVLGRFVGWW